MTVPFQAFVVLLENTDIVMMIVEGLVLLVMVVVVVVADNVMINYVLKVTLLLGKFSNLHLTTLRLVVLFKVAKMVYRKFPDF